MKKLVTVGLFAFGASLFFGCDEIDEAVDCAGICDRYKSCFDGEYDVVACVDECTDKADADAGFAAKVESCATCIDDESCAAATFECATDCAGVVP